MAINTAGYEHLAAGRGPDAIDLFTLNVEAFPHSLNAYDSLAEALVASGDRVRALEAARKTLAAIASDTTTPDPLKQQLRRLATAFETADLPGSLREFVAAAGLPVRLRDTAVPREAIPHMAEIAAKDERHLRVNPRPMGVAELAGVFEQAW